MQKNEYAGQRCMVVNMNHLLMKISIKAIFEIIIYDNYPLSVKKKSDPLQTNTIFET